MKKTVLIILAILFSFSVSCHANTGWGHVHSSKYFDFYIDKGTAERETNPPYIIYDCDIYRVSKKDGETDHYTVRYKSHTGSYTNHPTYVCKDDAGNIVDRGQTNGDKKDLYVKIFAQVVIFSDWHWKNHPENH